MWRTKQAMTIQTYDFGKQVDFILSHLEPPKFPRNIMTQRLGHQMEVFNREAMLRYFEHSDYQDCRISAYPRLSQFGDFKQVAPSLVMIDLDLNDVNVLRATLKRILKTSGTSPTVLWTGNGYHVYLPMKAFVLEQVPLFAEFSESGDTIALSTKFLRYAEQFFTDGKHDAHHRPSVNSCLLRVPGTYNSKNGERVKIFQEWDGIRPPIHNDMLRDFRVSLVEEELAQINNEARKKPSPNIGGHSSAIRWIEMLLQTPIADHRKYCLWRILAPYFANVRRLSHEESISAVRSWLVECNKLSPLEGRPSYSFRYNLNNARKVGYYPIALDNLKKENPSLYRGLMEKGK